MSETLFLGFAFVGYMFTSLFFVLTGKQLLEKRGLNKGYLKVSFVLLVIATLLMWQLV